MSIAKTNSRPAPVPNPAQRSAPVPLDVKDLQRVSGGLPRVGGWQSAPATTEQLPRVGGW